MAEVLSIGDYPMTTLKRIIPLDQAAPGMVLVDAVRQSDGSILLPEGCTLEEAQLASLQRRGIREVTVSAPANDAGAAASQPASADAVRAGVRRLFRKSETDTVTQGFFNTVLEYRLEKLK